MGKIIKEQEIGKIYGCYKILGFCDKSESKKLKCVCECQRCGNVKKVFFGHVRDRKYEYCTECKRPIKLKCDIVGQKFGKLSVIDYAENKIQPNGSSKKQYKCKCDCGNECIVQSNHLISGHTTSCGCAQKEKMRELLTKDISGERFGKLTAIERVNICGENKWRCMCDCGNETFKDIRNLKNGHTKSCGCLTSNAELEMFNILKENGYDFKKEYRIKECKDTNCLPFDFAIFKDDNLLFLIELQGSQHYYPFTFHSESDIKKKENLKDRIKKDRIKYNYCEEHNIPLLIIKYTNFNKLEEIINNFYSCLLSRNN